MTTILKFPGRRGRFNRLFQRSFLALCLILVLQPSPSTAQTATINRARITQVLDSPQVFIQNRQAKLNDSASRGQRVRTGRARAQLTFNTGAIGRLAQNSVLTVGQCAQLQRGKLLVNGAANGCTSSIVAGVRGTTYVLEVTDAGESRVNVLEGEVSVTRSRTALSESTPNSAFNTKQLVPSINVPLPNLATPIPTLPSQLPASQLPLPRYPQIPDPSIRTPSNRPFPEPLPIETSPILKIDNLKGRGFAPIVLRAGERVNISSTGEIGLIEKLTQADFTNLLTGNLFNGYRAPLPGITKIQQSFQKLFPGVPFPVKLPNIPTLPRVPRFPKLPIRLPFPF